MRHNSILKQASAAALALLLNPGSGSAELTAEFTRALSGDGDQRMQLVFQVEGSSSEYVVFAQGPSLGAAGVPGAMADPQINLLLNGASVSSNNNWGDDPSASRVSEVAAFYGITLAPQDAAMVRTLGPGLYTVVVTGADGGTGIARVGAAITPGSAPPDVGVACSVDACAVDSSLAQQCTEVVNRCLDQAAVDEEIDENDCFATALVICKNLF